VIVDSSAIVALVFREPGYEVLIDKLTTTDAAAVGTPTVAEAGIVISARLGRDARPMLRQLLEELGVAEIPFDERHWREAVGAWWRFGRGRHAAGLNLGDCLAYAVAKLADEPLLFSGSDFTKTDLSAA